MRDTILARGHGRDVGLAVLVPVARDDLRRKPRHRADRPGDADDIAKRVPVRREHEVDARGSIGVVVEIQDVGLLVAVDVACDEARLADVEEIRR